MDLDKDHGRSLEEAMTLSRYQVKNAIAPLQVIRRLTRVTSNAVLVGIYGFVGWIDKPRATPTVEILVAAGAYRKATDELLRGFRQLEADRQEMANDLRDKETQTVAVRIVKPLDRLHRQTLRRTFSFRWKGQDFRVPSLEMALVLAYVPMMTLPMSAPAKYLNAHDFIRAAKANLNVDLKKMASIVAVACPQSWDDLLEKIKRARADEPLHLPNSILPHA